MSIAIISPRRNPDLLAHHLKQFGIDVQIWPNIERPEQVIAAATWYHPPSSLSAFPNLKFISSMGAGVDHFFSDPELPVHLPMARFKDDSLTQEMIHYVLGAFFAMQQRHDVYRTYQREELWKEHRAYEWTVGILGLGSLGQPIASHFSALGVRTLGWSRTAKTLEGVECYHGTNGLTEVLSQADVLVGVLPLTKETFQLYNATFFAQCKKGARIIQAGRGNQLHENDLLDALNSGQISHAWIDVFPVEPLPKGHAFWHHPAITISPHVASLTRMDRLALQLAENYRRALHNEPILNTVTPKLGY